jgi:uncharacterized lipoprotein YddW (UPF0748 family)
MLEEHTALSSRKDIDGLIDFAKKAHIETLFVQIYRANQSWFPSRIADPSPYEKCLKNVGEDPLALLIRKAHGAGIEVHAWLNMLSLGENNDSFFLKKYGTSVLTRNLKKKRTLKDYKIDDQYFLEPGDPLVRQELLGIVREVLISYPSLDGIQFDYVRYPDIHPFYGHTKINMERFRKATGINTIDDESKEWKDWKRGQVTEFLGMLTAEARAIRPNIRVSATGCMPYSRAYYEAFQDWPSWLNHGLIDFVTIMGYSASPSELEGWIAAAKKNTDDFKKVNIAIGAYKLAQEPGILEKEFRFIENAGCRSCVIFHYGSFLQNPVLCDIIMKSHEK